MITSADRAVPLERALIGWVLNGSNPTELDGIRRFLAPTDFADPIAGRIFAAAVELLDQKAAGGGIPSSREYLDRAQRCLAVGEDPGGQTIGPAVAMGYRRDPRSPSDAAHWALRIVEESARRRLDAYGFGIGEVALKKHPAAALNTYALGMRALLVQVLLATELTSGAHEGSLRAEADRPWRQLLERADREPMRPTVRASPDAAEICAAEHAGVATLLRRPALAAVLLSGGKAALLRPADFDRADLKLLVLVMKELVDEGRRVTTPSVVDRLTLRDYKREIRDNASDALVTVSALRLPPNEPPLAPFRVLFTAKLLDESRQVGQLAQAEARTVVQPAARGIKGARDELCGLDALVRRRNTYFEFSRMPSSGLRPTAPPAPSPFRRPRPKTVNGATSSK